MPPLSVAVVVAIGVEQVVSPGPKVTLPEGDTPPITVAESETLPPAGAEPDGVVAMVGPPLPPAPAQVLTMLVSMVTAPVWAYRPPVLPAVEFSVMEALARMLPTKLVSVPSVVL